MTASTTTPSASTSKTDYCLQNAQAAKAAGNAALQANNLRGASFQYKKVYLFLAEYLPSDVTGPSTQPSGNGSSSSSGCGNGASGDKSNNGLVQMLQQQRRPVDAAAAASPPQQQEMLQLYATTLNNLALVHFKLGRYREGVTCATALLTNQKLRTALDSTQSPAGGEKKDEHGVAQPLPLSTTPAGKALLRRASCLVKLNEWAAAAADVAALNNAHAAAGVPPDPACEHLTAAISLGRAAETAKEKKMMQRMFA